MSVDLRGRFARTFEAISDGFLNAALDLRQSDETAGVATRALRDVSDELFDEAVHAAIVALIGVQAWRTHSTPRNVIDDLFERAPADAEWRAAVKR